MQKNRSSQQPLSSAQNNLASAKSSTDSASGDHLTRLIAWLTADAQHNSSANAQERVAKYLEDAVRAVIVKGRRIRTFAPFRQKHSALQTITPGQAVALFALLLAGVLGGIALGARMVVVLMAVVTAFYLGNLLFIFLLAVRAFNRPVEEQIDDRMVLAIPDANWPRYTILCPLYREARIVPQFIHAMAALDYPVDKLEILLLTEQDDAQTRNAILAMDLPSHFRILTVPAGVPRTKPRACNFGLLHATGDYIVIYDAEDIPDPLQLKKAVLTFANHGSDLACVQAKLNFYNPRQNLLTRWFTAEYSSWFDLILPGLQQRQLPLPLGGTSNHFRTEILRTLGAWDAFNVTEDCDLGLRLARYRLQTAILESTTHEEANPRLKNWLRQRSRWIKGYMQTYLVNMRQPSRYLHQHRLREFFWLQVLLGSRTAILLVNPFMWLLLAIYIALRPLVGDVYHSWFPAPVFYMGVLCLVFGNFFYIYMHLIGCLKRGQPGLIKWALLIPLYWALMSVAAFIALYQLIVKPHFWEKTQHGFHLYTPGSTSGNTSTKQDVGTPPPLSSDPPEHTSSGSAPPLSPDPEHTSSRPSHSTEQQARQGHTHSFWRTALLASMGVAGFVSLRACAQGSMKRGQPGLIKWALLLPFFLGVTSIAPFLAFSQRILRPQYRGKARNASSRHLSQAASSTSVTDALKLADIARRAALDRVAMQTPKCPAHHPKHAVWRAWFQDRWLVATLALACLASIGAWGYFYSTHQTLLYSDAYSHLIIARRLFDNVTPGLAQLGGVWLPLPHLLMLPFIWNDTLWRDGLAGSIPSMICYLIATSYIFLAARRLTKDSRASFVGTLLFILNPNILYLQATPLSELIFIATLTATAYYFICWAQEDHPKYLIMAAAGAFLGTIARYDGWFLFLVALLLIPLIGWLKRQRWAQIEGNLLVFGTLGGLGIALWLLWCAFIFGDPLYFQRGPYSAQAQQQVFIQENRATTYHNLWQSLVYYLLDAIETIGPLLLVLSIIALVVFVLKHRFSPSVLAATLFLTPFPFYVLSLYLGQAILAIPGVPEQIARTVPGVFPTGLSHTIFNARYGAQVVAPAALFLAILASYLSRGWPVLRILGQIILVIVILAQTVLIASGGIISLQDAQNGSCSRPYATLTYLAQHYNGGRILEDLYTSQVNELAEAGIDFKNIIYEGSGDLWNRSLASPATTVDWIIVNPDNPNDLVARSIDVRSPAFLARFRRVVQEPNGLSLFQRQGLVGLPDKPIPPDLLAQIHLCPGAGPNRSVSRAPAPAFAYRKSADVWSRGTSLAISA